MLYLVQNNDKQEWRPLYDGVAFAFDFPFRFSMDLMGVYPGVSLAWSCTVVLCVEI